MGELEPEEKSEFSHRLIQWWKISGRKFPWRTESDPYKIFIAEILLHRTRARNVPSVYSRFIKRFPDFQSLATADRGDVLEITRSLGLEWRTDKLLEASKLIMKDFGGRLPSDREKLLSLPGVGDYITSAVRVFSFGEHDELIDTNTVRIICRIDGRTLNDSTRRERKIKDRYGLLLNESDSRKFGYAMIDLASVICIPRKPRCDLCPVIQHCKTAIYSRTNSSFSKERM